MYRVERKYLCSDYDILVLKQRLSAVLPTDSHQERDCYRVCSLYLDTYDDECFYDNEDGADDRRKYRIRTYPGSDEKLNFEIKEKKNGKTKKEIFPVTAAECEGLLRGEPLAFAPDEGEDKPGGRQLQIMEQNRRRMIGNHGAGQTAGARNRAALLTETRLLRPVVVVDYERSAFVYPVGNVRITFDRNIAASCRVEDFLAGGMPLFPVLPEHMHLMEVKYDELLPDFIAALLDMGNLRQVTFSKYSICRQAVENGRYGFMKKGIF